MTRRSTQDGSRTPSRKPAARVVYRVIEQRELEAVLGLLIDVHRSNLELAKAFLAYTKALESQGSAPSQVAKRRTPYKLPREPKIGAESGASTC